MTYLDFLSDEEKALVSSTHNAEFATVSKAGVPIDTPTALFPSDDLTTFGVATGLAYPAKAERARRNPKVGLLVSGAPDQPVIAIAGIATVRDADLQANLERYVRETLNTHVINPALNDWNDVRQAVWYLTRIIIDITPVHVRVWPCEAAMDEDPREWRAPDGLACPPSDPPPAGKVSASPDWPEKSWQDLRDDVLRDARTAMLTLLDSNGFPIPMPVRAFARADEGFRLTLPRGVPWSSGKATLTFQGRETFVGNAAMDRAEMTFHVERALPILPLMQQGEIGQVIHPKPLMRENLMRRLEHEVARRNQSIPTVPETPPEPTRLCRARMESVSHHFVQLTK